MHTDPSDELSFYNPELASMTPESERSNCDICDLRPWEYRATVCGIETLICEECGND